MVKYCAVFNCNNSSANNVVDGKRVSFHMFPLKDEKLLKTWYIKMKRDNFTANENSRICSAHFEDDCFQYQNFTNTRFLKQGAIPTLFPHKCASKRKRTSYTFNNE